MEKSIFIRLEFFSLKGFQKGKDRKWSIKQIVEELVRVEHACPHVLHPQTPKIEFGNEPWTVYKECQDVWNEAKKHDPKNTKLTSKILLSGVVSYPDSIQTYCKNTYDKWKEKTISWIKNKYKNLLKCIVEHLDESHPHLHFLCVAPLDKDKKIDLGALCETQRKPENYKRNDRKYKLIKANYCKIMREYRKDYWQECGQEYGHLLHSQNIRKRLSRQEYHIQNDIKTFENNKLKRENEELRNQLMKFLDKEYKMLEIKKTLQALSPQRPKNIPSWDR